MYCWSKLVLNHISLEVHDVKNYILIEECGDYKDLHLFPRSIIQIVTNIRKQTTFIPNFWCFKSRVVKSWNFLYYFLGSLSFRKEYFQYLCPLSHYNYSTVTGCPNLLYPIFAVTSILIQNLPVSWSAWTISFPLDSCHLLTRWTTFHVYVILVSWASS